jgi:hypothetical protein
MTATESADLGQELKMPFAAHAGGAHVVTDDRHRHSSVRGYHHGADDPCLHVGTVTADLSNEVEAVSKVRGPAQVAKCSPGR